MDLITDKRKLLPIVEQGLDGKICLPDFQRDFVWSSDEIADLLRSMLRKYYVGSLLLLRCDANDPPFSPTVLRGARPRLTTLAPEVLVLDGQQRLTSLLYAFTAPNLSLKNTKLRRWFFVNLDLLLRDPEDDDIVLVRSDRDLKGLHTPATQYERRVICCTTLLRQPEFYTWRDGFEEWMEANRPDWKADYRATWRNAWTNAVNSLHGFEAPVVEVPRVDQDDGYALGRVCAIFEKLNSSGVELSIYDLLTARLYRSAIKVHDLWDEACDTNARLAEWSEGKADTHNFGVLALRTLALLRGLEAKPSVLIKLTPEKFADDWRRATASIERALELIETLGEDGFGVFDSKWLPFYGLVPVLAALRAEIETRGLGEQARAELRRWYWCNLFLERYSSGVESKSRKDYSEFLAHWTKNEAEPTVFEEARRVIGSPSFSVRSAASPANSIYCGVFCLLAKNGARDWRAGESITLQELQDHHIFPQDYLKRHGLKEKDRGAVNTILNRTLISNITNNKIKAKSPALYLTQTEIFPTGFRQDLVTNHFIDEEAVSCMKQAKAGLQEADLRALLQRFSERRERRIISEVRRVCGIAVSEASPSNP